MKKKNAFFLSETIVVMTVVAVVLLLVFKTYSGVYTKFKETTRYNTSSALTSLNSINTYFQSIEYDTTVLLNGSTFVDLTNNSTFTSPYYTALKQTLNIDKIYLINFDTFYDDNSINSFDLSFRKYLETLNGKMNGASIAISTTNDEYACIVAGSFGIPVLVGNEEDEYVAISSLGSDFVDPGYTGWSGSAPTTTWETTFNKNVEGTYYLRYDFNGYLLRRKVIVTQTEFAYTGALQMFVVPTTGWYQIELWGAEGGSAKYSVAYSGGLGGYTSGKILLNAGDILYAYVGGIGQTVNGTTSFTVTPSTSISGYNGGTFGTASSSNSTHGGGGGATDIRYGGTSLNDRIMVAAGGGGASSHSSTPKYSGNGGIGGSLIGANALLGNAYCYAYGTGGSQTSGGASTTCSSDGHAYAGVATFGIGNSPNTAYSTSNSYAGGGGGYYGGGAGWHAAAGGGSSFISSYAGVNAITSSSSTTPTNNTIHYSGKYFIDGVMTSGVNSGNGKATITYIGSTKPERVNTNLDNVRYIKSCTLSSSCGTDCYMHWSEFQAIYNGTNLALGKTVSGNFNTSNQSSSVITDGLIGATDTYHAGSVETSGERCILIDLESTYDLDEIAVWHYWGESWTYNNDKILVSSDGTNYSEVLNVASAVETSQGKRVNAYS